MKNQYQDLLTFALELAKAAEGRILPHYRHSAISLKADGTEVTNADRQAEIAMRDMIAQRFPAHDVLGEEFGGSVTSNSGQQWILDPLDGTTWFTLGMPLFGTLVAYVESNEPVVGVIHFPVLGETVYAAKGLGCWYRCGDDAPVQVQVSDGVSLNDAVVSASGVHGSDIYRGTSDAAYQLTPVLNRARKFRFCGDCMQHALVCRGNAHVAIDTLMQPWDVAALIPCIEEAGGIATSLNGQREKLVSGGSLLTSCHPQLHEEVLKMLQA